MWFLLTVVSSGRDGIAAYVERMRDLDRFGPLGSLFELSSDTGASAAADSSDPDAPGDPD